MGKYPVAIEPEDTKIDGLLSEKQRAFVHHLVHNQLGQIASARQAGFLSAGPAANKLMKLPKIQRAIAIAREEYAKSSAMTKKKVVDGFAEAIDIARIKGDPIAMVAGWREIGKLCGFYEPTKTKIELSVNGRIMVERLNTLSDDELLKLAEGDASVIEGDFIAIGDDSE